MTNILYYLSMLRYHRDSKPPLPTAFRRAFISLFPFLLPHSPHGAHIQLGIITVLGLGITEHVREAGAAMQVAEEIGFEGEHFLVDIRLLHPYAISKNRQAAISLLEVALKPIVP